MFLCVGRANFILLGLGVFVVWGVAVSSFLEFGLSAETVRWLENYLCFRDTLLTLGKRQQAKGKRQQAIGMRQWAIGSTHSALSNHALPTKCRTVKSTSSVTGSLQQLRPNQQLFQSTIAARIQCLTQTYTKSKFTCYSVTPLRQDSYKDEAHKTTEEMDTNKLFLLAVLCSALP